MTSEPTPFERLLTLEHLVGELRAQLNPTTPNLEESEPPQRHLWPADELLAGTIAIREMRRHAHVQVLMKVSLEESLLDIKLPEL